MSPTAEYMAEYRRRRPDKYQAQKAKQAARARAQIRLAEEYPGRFQELLKAELKGKGSPAPRQGPDGIDIKADLAEIAPNGSLFARLGRAADPRSIYVGKLVTVGDFDGNSVQAKVMHLTENGVVRMEVDLSTWQHSPADRLAEESTGLPVDCLDPETLAGLGGPE